MLAYAYDAKNEKLENPQNKFYSGRMLAFYEVLDTIKNEIITHDLPPEMYGLDHTFL